MPGKLGTSAESSARLSTWFRDTVAGEKFGKPQESAKAARLASTFSIARRVFVAAVRTCSWRPKCQSVHVTSRRGCR